MLKNHIKGSITEFFDEFGENARIAFDETPVASGVGHVD
jgi:hypothetical protein